MASELPPLCANTPHTAHTRKNKRTHPRSGQLEQLQRRAVGQRVLRLLHLVGGGGGRAAGGGEGRGDGGGGGAVCDEDFVCAPRASTVVPRYSNSKAQSTHTYHTVVTPRDGAKKRVVACERARGFDAIQRSARLPAADSARWWCSIGGAWREIRSLCTAKSVCSCLSRATCAAKAVDDGGMCCCTLCSQRSTPGPELNLCTL